MKASISVLVVILVFANSYGQRTDRVRTRESSVVSRAYNPDQDRTTCELVTARGFLCETHLVTTYQGYRIELHRIVSPKPSHTRSTNYPVILQPGLIGTSADFVMATANVSPNVSIIGRNMGFELCKQGYDVWLSNNRGSQYGLGHVSLDARNRTFWRFSFDEIAQFDTPAIVDFVLNSTKAKKVHFVGHSQGSAVMFALLSQTSSYNEPLASYIAISPITRIGQAKTSFRLLISSLRPFLVFNGGPVFTSNFISRSLVPLACDLPPTRFVCTQAFFSVVGPDHPQLEKDRIPVYMAHMPTSTSAQNLLHFHQLFASDRFQKYDYGRRGNLKHYGQREPPIYDLTNITYSRLYVIYSDNDWFVPLSGVKRLRHDLRHAASEFYRISNRRANHIDPLVGIDVAVEVNQQVLAILRTND